MPSPEAGATTPAASPASTTSRPLSQRLSGLSGMGAPSRRTVSAPRRPVRGAQGADRVAQGEALLRAADADARGAPVREDPAVEVGRDRAAVVDVAAGAVEAGRAVLGRADDLVIGEDERRLVPARHRLSRDARDGAVGPDHGAGANARRGLAAAFRAVADAGNAVRVAVEPLEGAGAADGTRGGGPLAQPLVEHLAVDHADEAALDRDVDPARARRHHPGRGHARDQEAVGDREVADEPRRDGAAAGLDPPRPVEQQHRPAAPGEVGGRRGAGRPAADHHRIEGLAIVRHGHLLPTPATWPWRGGWAPRCRARAGRPIRAASTPARRKSPASPTNTAA